MRDIERKVQIFSSYADLMQKKQKQKTSAEAARHRKKEFMSFLFCRNGSGAKNGRVGNAARSFFKHNVLYALVGGFAG